MSKFKFPYTKAGPFTVPLIPLILKNDQNKIQTGYVAMIDSGASFNVFHTDVAAALQLDLTHIKDKVMFRGVGGKGKDFIGKTYILKLMISQKGESHEFDTLVVFSEDISSSGYPLLGMTGFFDNFKSITFDNKGKKVVLES